MKEIPGHEYDGIQELDNGLPQWWLITFYGAIVFSILYVLYYWAGPGLTIQQIYDKAQAERAMALASAPGPGLPSEQELNAALASESQKKKGHEVYTLRCVSCHGAEGEGGIGANLTDRAWIHGGKIQQIAKTIAEGVLDKGMPPWGAVISHDELVAVTAYVKSLKGTHPANPKAPQGTQTDD